MRILVYMRDGRTVYYFQRRKDLGAVLSKPAEHEGDGVVVVRGVWNPATGEYAWSRSITIRHLDRRSISVVEEAAPNDVHPPKGDDAS